MGLALVAVLSAPARALPATNGKIAFVASRDGNYEIYSMLGDGSGLTNLTNNAAGDLAPEWSADGQKIVFTSFRDGNAEIYVMNADGSGVTRLTNNASVDSNPSWSPDGQKIAFRSDRDGGDYEIYSMNTDGTGQTRLTNSPGSDDFPAWSPVGTKIAFETQRDGNYEIYSMNPDGTGQTDLTNDPEQDRRPTWSPGSQKIAFDSHRDGNWEIYSMNADGTGQTRLTNNASDDSEPAWSPDNTKIAFRSQRDGNGEVYFMNADGSGQARLTNDPSFDSRPSWGSGVTGYPRPKGATPMRSSLVPASNECTSPDRTHALPLAVGSCSGPTQTSSYLTIGTPDANGAAANSVGSVRLDVVGSPSADLKFTVSVTDVRCEAIVATCGSPNTFGGADYTGQLQLNPDLRITDRNSGSGTTAATVVDTTFAVTLPCSPTASSAIGSSCSVTVSANTLMPGLVVQAKRMTWQVQSVKVYDGGADGQASTTGDNQLFMQQGIFVP